MEPSPGRYVLGALMLLAMAALCSIGPARMARALEPVKSDSLLGEGAIALVPELESYIANSMKAFDVPGLAIGIVAGDKLVYAKGFGVRSKAGEGAVDPRTIFQIGSTIKAFWRRRWPLWPIGASCTGTTGSSTSSRTSS